MPLFQLPQLISQLVNAQVAITQLREFLHAISCLVTCHVCHTGCATQILRMPLFQLPQLISQLVNAQVAITRLREFLAAAEQHSMPETAPAGTGISHTQYAGKGS